jgi:pimeloyl-ACP methyl ester carboxylesterase
LKTLGLLAKNKIAILSVVGDSDDVVPVEENTAVAENLYKELGGVFEVIHKPGVGHHPHGLDDPTPVVEFIEKYTVQK